MEPEDQDFIKKEFKGTSTEAPLSVHIDTYFKGFHAGITIRKEDNSKVPVESIKTAIECLISSGFEPSWNKTTSMKHLETKTSPASSGELVEPSQIVCGVHGTPLTLIPAGVSKTSGRPYPSFYACQSLNADGSKCKWKPEQ